MLRGIGWIHKRLIDMHFILFYFSATSRRVRRGRSNLAFGLSTFNIKGGRQVDGAISSFLALEEIMANKEVRDAQERGKFTVLFDSGIRTGSDVLKAIAMGAQGVLCTFFFPVKHLHVLTSFLLYFAVCRYSLNPHSGDGLDISSQFGLYDALCHLPSTFHPRHPNTQKWPARLCTVSQSTASRVSKRP